MEWHVPELIWQSQEVNYKRCVHEIIWYGETLYLETDASGVYLGTGLLQVRRGMNCGCDKVLEKAPLHLIAFASKNLFSAEQQYSNIEQ